VLFICVVDYNKSGARTEGVYNIPVQDWTIGLYSYCDMAGGRRPDCTTDTGMRISNVGMTTTLTVSVTSPVIISLNVI
jgi:hypothetical protein